MVLKKNKKRKNELKKSLLTCTSPKSWAGGRGIHFKSKKSSLSKKQDSKSKEGIYSLVDTSAGISLEEFNWIKDHADGYIRFRHYTTSPGLYLKF